MHQVDLAPTLALLLGIPIPFSNLGSVNLHLISPEKNPDLAEARLNLVKETHFRFSFFCIMSFIRILQISQILIQYLLVFMILEILLVPNTQIEFIDCNSCPCIEFYSII